MAEQPDVGNDGEPPISRAEGLLNRLGQVVRNATAVVVAIAVVLSGAVAFAWWALGRDATDDPEPPATTTPDVVVNVTTNDGCIVVVDGTCIFQESQPTSSQRAWLDLSSDELLPNAWRLAESWDDIADAVFDGETEIVFEPDEQLADGRAVRTTEGFRLEITDLNTVTANLGAWTGPWDPPFFVRVGARQLGGPLDHRACGIQFNAKYGVDYELVENRWFMAKASGSDAQVTRWAPRNSEGAINHPQYELFTDVLDANSQIVIEVLVEVDQWSVRIDDRVVAQRQEQLGRSFAFPAAQQETQWRTGNVVCEFSDWEVWLPEGN